MICIKLTWKCPIGNQIINTSIPQNVGRVRSGLLQAHVASKISMEEEDIVSNTQFCLGFFLRGSFIANQSNDQILGVF